MAPGVIESIREWLQPPDDEHAVEEYVLSRSEPDPENRIRVYDSPADPTEVQADASLPAGTYILQEVKPSGMAGDIVWEEELEAD